MAQNGSQKLFPSTGYSKASVALSNSYSPSGYWSTAFPTRHLLSSGDCTILHGFGTISSLTLPSSWFRLFSSEQRIALPAMTNSDRRSYSPPSRRSVRIVAADRWMSRGTTCRSTPPFNGFSQARLSLSSQGGLVDPRMRTPKESLPFSIHLLKGAAEAAFHCAHRTSTVSSCAFCEQERHLAAPSPPSEPRANSCHSAVFCSRFSRNPRLAQFLPTFPEPTPQKPSAYQSVPQPPSFWLCCWSWHCTSSRHYSRRKESTMSYLMILMLISLCSLPFHEHHGSENREGAQAHQHQNHQVRHGRLLST